MEYCDYCGVSSHYGICPFCRFRIDSQTTICPSCGRDLGIPPSYRLLTLYSNAIACPHCRTPYVYADLPKAQREQFRQYRRERGCFIATAAYGTPLANEISVLRVWRDTRLEPAITGRAIIRLYYAVSPPIAHLVWHHKLLRRVVRRFIGILVRSFIDT